ncbi:serine/threonine-protein kinase [Nocardia sp. NPDC058658]|uniref:serine/threonine-protein kinase n=1 Tax=Nocardia sp. NPDC058658 TaxID=3346580 RepID=UPI00364D8CF4
MRLQPGTTVGGYLLTGMLGAGGYGAVYLAQHPRLQRSVALKVLHPGYAADPGVRSAFDRETELIARLDHPNIVAVYDRNARDDEHLWLSMRHVTGGDLDAQITANPSGLEPHRVARLIAGVAHGLDHAHRNGVLHRDVKPANILIEEHPDGERAVLTDFGIARALGATATPTASGVVATLAYAAPERLVGQAVDHRADVYSLGCTAFHLLTGQHPFDSTDPAAAIAAHLSQAPPRPRDRQPSLPTYLDIVIATALSKDPEHRYSTCSELADNLTRAVTSTTSVASGAVHHAGTESELRQCAKAGDVKAMTGLGTWLHQQGDTVEAEVWTRRAADAGDITAMYNLGISLQRRGDTAETEIWWRRAAQAGDCQAMHNLAVLLRQRGDPTEAESWWRRAADVGYAKSMYNLGALLARQGHASEAELWTRRAARTGDIDAMYNLGVILHQRGDTSQATDWWRRAATSGHAGAIQNLEILAQPPI